MATRRKVRDEGDANGLLTAWRASGLELPEFCAAEGVDGRSLSCWRRNIARRGEQRSPRTPVPLRLVEVRTTPVPMPATYKLTLGEVTIEVDDDFRDETLARLLDLVSTC